MKVEWPYLLVLVIAISFGIFYYFEGTAAGIPVVELPGQIQISGVHTLFLVAGGILTAALFIVSSMAKEPIELTGINFGNFCMATALGNLGLGLPILFGGTPVKVLAFKPTELLVTIAAEEVFRIGAALWLIYAFGKGPGLFMSAIVFALMHMFWFPAQWFFAVFGGFLLSALLVQFETQLASVATHYLYDMAILGYLTPLVFFALTIVLLLIGYVIRRRKQT